jgi:hypothetical protein
LAGVALVIAAIAAHREPGEEDAEVDPDAIAA